MFNAIKSLFNKAKTKLLGFTPVRYFLAASVIAMPLACLYMAIKVFLVLVAGHTALIPITFVWVVLMVLCGVALVSGSHRFFRIPTFLLFTTSRFTTGVLAFSIALPVVIPAAIVAVGFSYTLYIVSKVLM